MDEGSIQVPLDRAYHSYDEAYAALKEHGMHHGYGFHITATRRSGYINTRTYFSCDKERKYKSKARTRV